MDWSQVINYLPEILQGLGVTILLMCCALIIGFSFAVLLTLCSLSHRKYITAPIHAFVFFIRGTPLLVQIYLIYFGSGQFTWLYDTVFWDILRQPFACAIIAFALNTCGYIIALLRGAIQSVPEGEITACQALGMSKWLAIKHVILPRAFRIVLPAYSNEVIMLLKGTSLASTITILDLMGMTNQIIAQTYSTIQFLLIAGLLYFMLNAIIIALFKLLEQKANHYLCREN